MHYSNCWTAVPHSHLLLKAPSLGDASALAAFSGRLQALGVDLARVVFRGPTGLKDMMAEYAEVDIALDPVPYNGGTTSLQAMWMGVPVVTLAGEHFVSRMGASFMTAAGLPEWVADDDDGYVQTRRAPKQPTENYIKTTIDCQILLDLTKLAPLQFCKVHLAHLLVESPAVGAPQAPFKRYFWRTPWPSA